MSDESKLLQLNEIKLFYTAHPNLRLRLKKVDVTEWLIKELEAAWLEKSLRNLLEKKK